jgi:hypothetical protein
MERGQTTRGDRLSYETVCFIMFSMRHRILTLLAMALAVPIWIGAQTPASGDIGQDLKTVQRKWTAALVQNNAKLLDEVLEDNYIETDEEGNQMDKKGILEALKSGDLKMTSIQLSGMRIHAYVVAAVVTGHALQTGTYKGRKVPQVVVFTDTFLLMNGSWKVVASHRSGPHDQ